MFSINQKMKYVGWVLAIVLGMLLVFSVIAIADSQFNIDPDYPGYVNSGLTIDLAYRFTQMSVNAYFRVHGHYPESWQAVVDDGLCPAQLLSASGNVVDPGDGSLDFNGDSQYSLQNGNAYVSFKFLNQAHHTQLNGDQVTYGEFLQAGAAATGNDELLEIVGDIDQLRLYAYLSYCETAIYHYLNRYGTVPPDWQTLLDSGLAPINGDTPNPKSGQPMSASTGAWSIRYEKVDQDTYILRHRDQTGQEPACRISY
jgi:hypothetical protein